MSPATTIDALDRRIQRGEPGRETGERALERDRILGDLDARRHGEVRAGRHDDDDVGRNGADGIDGVVEQRPAVDDLGELVAPEPRRPATGKHDRPDPLGHGTACCGRGAFGPGTWPSGVRRRMARRSRSSRMAITYLRLVPVASR